MTGSDAAHDAHADHSIAATLALLVIVALFCWLFAVMDGGGVTVGIWVVAAIFSVFGLLWIWVLDRD